MSHHFILVGLDRLLKEIFKRNALGILFIHPVLKSRENG